MKVMIGYPPIDTTKGVPLLSQNRQFQYFNNPTFIYPVIPAYAATFLKQAGYDVVWADGIAEGKSMTEYAKELVDFAPDLYVCEVKTPVVKHVWEAIRTLKEHCPKTCFILMGDHITALPEESFAHCPVDYCLTSGNFDFSLLNLVNHLARGEALKPGVYWRQGDQVKNSGHFVQDQSLQDMPLIDRDLTKWKLYAYNNGNFKFVPGTYTMIGRDCWYRQDGGCTFCSWTTTFPKFQCGTPEHMLNEVEHLAKNYGVREIFDDTGTFPIGGWLEKFCNGMVERGLHKQIKIGCNMRPGAIGQKEYDMMAKANFRFILFGLESANQKTLDRINKGQKPGDMRHSARMAKEAGLEPHVTCMVGYPWESREEARATIDMTRDLFQRGWIDTLQATMVIPYPGTQLFKECDERGWLKTRDWNEYDMRMPVMKCPMPDEEVMGMTQGIYTSAITPSYLIRKVLGIRSLDDVKYLWRGVLAMWGHLTDFSKDQVKKK